MPIHATSRWALTVLATLALSLVARPVAAQDGRFELNAGDHVMVVGNTFSERMAQSGYFDSVVHAAFPDGKIMIRHVPNSADEVAERPREHSVPTMEDNLKKYEADIIFMCFGMSESFEGLEAVDKFRDDLAKQIDAFQNEKYNGESAPRLVLISPIAHEDLGAPYPTGDAVTARNRTLKVYTETMKSVAQAKGVTFVDLFTPSAALYEKNEAPLTANGIHPNELGMFHFTKEIAKQVGWLTGDAAASKNANELRQLAWDKHYHFRHLYRATNTEYVWGRRAKPFGVVNFPPEQAQLEKMIAAREQAMWEMDKPSPAGVFAAAPGGQAIWMTSPSSSDFEVDKWTPPPIDPQGRENSLGDINIADAEDMLDSFTVPEGYKIEVFASEKDFEELASPLSMAFDYKGRLWVLCAITYPHELPGTRPDCKLIILEDTDKDGKADKRTVFARYMNIPTGFIIDTDCVYIGQAPDLYRYVDTDGDDVADYREIVHSGFGMPDSHHTISAFKWDPNGGFTMSEGVFMKTNIESPWGTMRTRDAAIWRFDPANERLIAVAHSGHPNPWGITYDGHGQAIYMDTSGPNHYNYSQLISAFEYPNKTKNPPSMLSRGRPTAGNEIIYSRHFPDEAQGTHLVNQCIGFHGTRWDKLIANGATQSGYSSEPMPTDMVSSTDANFRPVDVEVAPDGSLYILDWCNPLIGHMQYSVRDPRRDNTHGRVWRITYPERPLIESDYDYDLTKLSTQELLEELLVPEINTRQLARRILQKSDPAEVNPAIDKWLQDANPRDPAYDQMLLEALWIVQGMGEVDLELLDETLRSRTPEVRAAAIRCLRWWLQWEQVDATQAQRFLTVTAVDPDMRVRLEAVAACGFMKSPQAKTLVELAANMPMDAGMRVVVENTLKYLASQDFEQPKEGGIGRLFELQEMQLKEFVAMEMDDQVALITLVRDDLPREASEEEPADPALEQDDTKITIERRLEALSHLAGDDPAKRAEVLTELTRNDMLDKPAMGRALTSLVADLSSETIAAMRDGFSPLSESDVPELRQVAIAVLLRAGEPLAELAERDSAAVLDAINRFRSDQLPPGISEQLMGLVDEGVIPPAAGIEQAFRLSDDSAAMFTWLAGHVDAAAELSYDQWGREHRLAMGALRVMHQVAPADWPAGFEDYRFEPVSEAFLQAGHDVYYKNDVGCYKCHGDQGQGDKDSFPPLAGSPWALGEPYRAAAIVVHGLKGPLEVYPGGPKYDAQMEGLGGGYSDGEIAAVLTYIRQSFGNFAPPVSPAEVAYARNNAAPPEGMTWWEPTALLNKFPFERDRLLGPDRVPNRMVQVWTPPSTGMVQMFLIVSVLMLLILLATYFGGRGGGVSSGLHSAVPA